MVKYGTVFNFTSNQRNADVENEEHFYAYYWKKT